MKLLEDTDMEHIVNASSGRQVEANGDVVDDLGDAIWPVVSGLQLAGARVGQGGDRAVSEAKKDPIAHHVGDVAVRPVVVVLLDLLRLFEAMTHIRQELVTVGDGAGHSRHPGVPRLIRPDRRRVTPIYNPERGVLERALVGGVEDVLRPRKPLKPLARPVASEAAQVHGDDAVGRLGLPVGLWVERR